MAWYKLFSKEDFKPSSIIQFLCKDTKTLRYGQVDRVEGDKCFVQIANGVFLVLHKANAIWCFVPTSTLHVAKTCVHAAIDARKQLGHAALIRPKASACV